MHACQFRIGQLLAICSVLVTHGFDRLAAAVLEHSRMHDDETREAA